MICDRYEAMSKFKAEKLIDMKKYGLLSIVLLIVLSGLAQNSQDSAWIRDNYIKKEIYITMRDGVKLFTSIYMPKDATEKHQFY